MCLRRNQEVRLTQSRAAGKFRFLQQREPGAGNRYRGHPARQGRHSVGFAIVQRVWFGVVVAASLSVIGCGPKEAVYVTASALNLRGGPFTKAKVIGRLLRGLELAVVQRTGAWVEVEADGSVTGWVHGDYVGDPDAVRAAHKRDRRKRSAARRVSTAKTTTGESPARNADDATRLNLTVDQLLAGFPDETTIEDLEPLGGESRARAEVNGGPTADFWGEPRNLSRAALLVPVVGEPDEVVRKNADLVLTFVRNAVPRWRRDGDWLAARLRELSSKDAGKMGFDADGVSVRFDYIKPLGSVRVFIQPQA